MGRLSILVAAVLIATQARAQFENSNYLHWEDKKLEWADFQGIPLQASPFHSGLSYFIGYTTKKYKVDDLKIKGLVAFCYVDKNASWVKQGSQNQSLLLYNQILFDLAELYSRKLQSALNRISGSELYRADEILHNLNSQFNQRANQFSESSEYGKKSDVIEAWSAAIAYELTQFPRERMPIYRESKFGLGATIGGGYGILTNSLDDYFSNNINLDYGFDVAYGKPVLYLRATLGLNHVNAEYTNAGKIWEKDLKTTLAVLEATLGYPVSDNSKFRISPFLGIAGFEFSARSSDEAYGDFRVVKAVGVFGINCDYKFSKQLSLVDIFKEKVDWIIRTRIFVIPARFDSDFKGASINLSVGIGGFARFAKTN